jgi:hypothetical protein
MVAGGGDGGTEEGCKKKAKKVKKEKKEKKEKKKGTGEEAMEMEGAPQPQSRQLLLVDAAAFGAIAFGPKAPKVVTASWTSSLVGGKSRGKTRQSVITSDAQTCAKDGGGGGGGWAGAEGTTTTTCEARTVAVAELGEAAAAACLLAADGPVVVALTARDGGALAHSGDGVPVSVAATRTRLGTKGGGSGERWGIRVWISESREAALRARFDTAVRLFGLDKTC